MSNFDTVKQVQRELNDGWHFGSALAENAQYVDSLHGKLNKLKETWVGIFQTIFDSNAAKGFANVLISISEAIASVVSALDKMGLLGVTSFAAVGLGIKKLVGHTKESKSEMLDLATSVVDLVKGSKGIKTVSEGVETVGKVSKLSTLASSGLLKSLLGFGAAGLVIGGVVSYVDNLREKERQAYEERKKNIESMQESTKQMQSQREGLSGIVAEYDRLSSKAKLSEKELERFNQLKKQIADTNPELTEGIDANGNPIIKLNTTLQEYMTNLDKTIAKQQSLTYADLKANSKQAMKTLKKYDTVASDSNSEILLAHQLSYNKKIEDLRRKEQQAYQKYLTSQGKDREKALADLRAYQNEEQEVYAEKAKNFDIVKNDIEQAATQLSQRMTEGFKSNKIFTGLSEDLQSQFLEFSNSLDFSEITSEDMFADAQVSLQNLLKLAQNGKLDFKDLQKSISEATKEFNQTGDMDAYVKNIDEILNSVNGLNQIDKNVLRNMFVGVPEALIETGGALDTVLEKFGKTQIDLQNGDILANNLKKQFESVTALADLEVSSDAKVNLNIVTDIINNNELPTELRNLVNQMVNDGVDSDKIIEVVKQIALDYQLDGELDQEGLQKFIDNQVGEGKYTITPEMVVDPKIESKAKEKLEQELQKYEKINGRQEIKTLFTTDVVGLEKAQLFEEIIKKLPANEEFTNKFMVDFATELSELESYEEVLTFIDSLPDEIKKKYDFKVETNAEEEKEKLDRIESMQFTDKQQRIIADTTDAEYKLQLFQSMTPDEMSMVLNLNSVPAEEKLAFFNSLSPEQKIAILTCDPTPGIGVLEVWDSLSAEDKKALIEADPSGALAQLGKYNNTPVKDKKSKITADNSDAVKKSTTTTQKILGIPNVHNTAINAKDNASSVVDSVNKKKVKNKTFTITGVFKTIGNAVSNFFGGKEGKSAPSNQGRAISHDYSISTISEQPNVDAHVSESGIPNRQQGIGVTDPISPLSRATVKTPINISSSNVLDSIEYSIELLQELYNRIGMVNNQLGLLEEKYKNAVGNERITFLKKQNELLKEQAQLQNELKNKLAEQQAILKKELSSKGFVFTSDNNLKNYEEKLLQMEREAEKLEKAAESASKKVSDYSGKDENTRKKLEKDSNKAKEKADKYNESLSTIKKQLSEYINITNQDLPDATKEWESLNNEIKKNNDELEKLNRRQQTFRYENKLTELERQYGTISDQLSKINQLMENAYGQDKLRLIQDQISLLEKQKGLQKQIIDQNNAILSVYKKDLQSYGFIFDNSSNITNIDEILNKFENSEDLEKINDLLKEFFNIQDSISDAKKDWQGLENEIKDAYKEQLKITKEIEEKITEVYKKQVEERKKLIDEELDKRLDALEKEKKAYNDARKEADYNKDYNKQMETIADLERQIDILSRDNSLSGQKKLQELMKQLASEQEKLQDMVQDKLDEQVNNIFDKEQNRLEQEADKAKDNLDEMYSDEKLQQIVKDTLASGVFVGVNGEIQDLQSTLIDFENKFGEGMSAMGDIIKNELVANLNVAKNTISDMSRILNELDLKKFSSELAISGGVGRSVSHMIQSSRQTTQPVINFNSELIRVEGNITEDVLPQVEEMLNTAKRDIVREIVNNM